MENDPQAKEKKPKEKPLTDEDFFEPLDELLEEEETLEDEEELDPDDPWDNEKIMRMKKSGSGRIASLWD